MSITTRRGRDFIARHGETVFNAARRFQGDHSHTPLTREGFAKADAMGEALRRLLGPRSVPTLWSSPAGRALQTLAIVAEHLGLDWHGTRADHRLAEIDIGDWGGRYYEELIAEVSADHVLGPGATLVSAPNGEAYPNFAARLAAWIDDTRDEPHDRLIVMHGISSHVMRGILTGRPPDALLGASIAADLPQGSLVVIECDCESIMHSGRGVRIPSVMT